MAARPLVVFALGILNSILAWGAGVAQAQTARQFYTFDMTINEDRLATYTVRIETTPLTTGAVQTWTSARIAVTSNQTATIEEAYTRKSDGRRIEVDRSQIAVQDGEVGQLSSTTDIKYQQVPFRDLGKGDTTVLLVRYAEQSQFIPGFLSERFFAYPGSVEWNMNLKVSVPAAMMFNHAHKGFTYTADAQGTRVEHRWTGKFYLPAVKETSVASYLSSIPSVNFSTFESYEQLGRDALRPTVAKALVTPGIKAMAATLTSGSPDVRSKTKAIYEWVAQHIKYSGVYFGSGRYVANDPDLILARRYGDCKDHAALMIALLSAAGIEAEAVLINSGDEYELPKVPMLQAFNHMIVYVPALGLYLDATSPYTAFGDLPDSDLNQPVIHASKAGVTLARTPVDLGLMWARVETAVRIEDDGGMIGETNIEATGDEAQTLRAFVEKTETKGEEATLQQLASSRDISGVLTMDEAASSSYAEPYKLRIRWETDIPVAVFEKGWTPTLGATPVTPYPYKYISRYERSLANYAVTCRSGRFEHILRITMPDDVALASRPQPVAYTSGIFTMKRTWSVEGHTVTIATHIDARTNGRACSAQDAKAVTVFYEGESDALNPVLRFTRRTATSSQGRNASPS